MSEPPRRKPPTSSGPLADLVDGLLSARRPLQPVGDLVVKGYGPVRERSRGSLRRLAAFVWEHLPTITFVVALAVFGWIVRQAVVANGPLDDVTPESTLRLVTQPNGSTVSTLREDAPTILERLLGAGFGEVAVILLVLAAAFAVAAVVWSVQKRQYELSAGPVKLGSNDELLPGAVHQAAKDKALELEQRLANAEADALENIEEVLGELARLEAWMEQVKVAAPRFAFNNPPPGDDELDDDDVTIATVEP